MSTITASLINLTNSTPQNGHLSTQPKNPTRCPLDPLAQQAKSVLIPITKRGISTLFIYQKHRHTGVYELLFCAFKDCYGLDMPRDSGKHNHAVRLFVETYRKPAYQMRKHIEKIKA